jgi:phenylacetate-CoA ligase
MDIVKVIIERAVYPLMEKYKGNKIRLYIEELKINGGMSNDEIIDMQNKKLKKLLLECIKSVPAYKKYSNLKDDIIKNPGEAIRNFPVLTKKIFQKHTENYLSENASKESLINNCSGGSTGEPVKFYMDRKTVEYYEAARWRGLSWWGITPGSRSVMIWGNPQELSKANLKKFQLKERFLKNRIVIPAFSLKPEKMKDYIKKIKKFKPEYIYGYASALDLFSQLVQKQNLKIPKKLKAVVSTAETLYDYQRKLIKETFNCPVVNEYGARDAGIIAYECKYNKMHLTNENIFIEIVDPKTLKPVPAGESDMVLITDLNNYKMPRIRYQLGDRVTLSDTLCKCGQNHTIIKNIDGRVDDVFVTIDGKYIHGNIFNQRARVLNSIKKFQIIQKKPSLAILKIAVKDNYNTTEIDSFIKNIKNTLPGTNIEHEIVNDIEASKSGKFRCAIREFDL